MYMSGTIRNRIRGKLLTVVLAILGMGAVGIVPATAGAAPTPIDPDGCSAHLYVTNGTPASANIDGVQITVREDVPVGWTVSWVNNGPWQVIKVGTGSSDNFGHGAGGFAPVEPGQFSVFVKYHEGLNNTANICIANTGVTLSNSPTVNEPVSPALAKLHNQYVYYHDRYLRAACKGVGKPGWGRAIAINGRWYTYHRNRIQRRIEAGIMQNLFSTPEGTKPLPMWKDVFPDDCAPLAPVPALPQLGADAPPACDPQACGAAS